MGGGVWTHDAFRSYSLNTGKAINKDGTLDRAYKAQDIFKKRSLAPELDPYNVKRECRDSEEHPNTIPVILALDVTGSMGDAAAECAKKLNEIMTQLYSKVADVEFMIMAIGDLAYDCAPIQISQFESDIRIAEQLDKVYFEAGGGGNKYESYTAAWYMGLYHTDLDCWERGKKGIIITLGDEGLNPYLPKAKLQEATGDKIQGDIETSDLYEEVKQKFGIYHLAVNDKQTSYEFHKGLIKETWGKLLDGQHFMTVTIDGLTQAIIDIVSGAGGNVSEPETVAAGANEISW